jgi:hypothetical protein
MSKIAPPLMTADQTAWSTETAARFNAESDCVYAFSPFETRDGGLAVTLFCDGVMVDEYRLKAVRPVYVGDELRAYKEKLFFRRLNREWPLQSGPIELGPQTEIAQFVSDQWAKLTGQRQASPRMERLAGAPDLAAAGTIELRELENEA